MSQPDPAGDAALQLVKKHWRERGFWSWFWREHVPLAAKALTLVLLLAAIGSGGVLAAVTLSSAKGTTSYVLETTVRQVVTVREHGKLVRKLVPVVRKVRVAVNPTTVDRLRTLTVAGSKQVVTDKLVRLVPTVQRLTKTATRTALVTNLQTVTNQQTVINQQTVTNQQTIVNNQTVVNERTVTNDHTVTQTQTETSTQTVTQVQTVTETITTTRATTDTVTVTVTTTTGGG